MDWGQVPDRQTDRQIGVDGAWTELVEGKEPRQMGMDMVGTRPRQTEKEDGCGWSGCQTDWS